MKNWKRYFGAILLLPLVLFAVPATAGLDSSQLTITFGAPVSGTATAFTAPTANVNKTFNLSMATGTAANQADRIVATRQTITASSNFDMDLAGVLTDTFGATVTFAKVKMIYVEAATTNANDVVIGNATSNQFVGPFGAAAHTATIGPGDVFLITRRGTAGLAVTAGTGDILRITNGGGGTSVTVDIIIVGTSA